MRPDIIEVYRAENNRTRFYNLDHSKDVLRFAARERFAWPGGYEYIVSFQDGSTLCSKCLRERFRAELEDLESAGKLSLYTGADIDPGSVYCEHCNKDCSAYVEEEV